jgi:hypothetical protein
MWLKDGTGGILKANCDSVMACGAASTGLPEMMRPNMVVVVDFFRGNALACSFSRYTFANVQSDLYRRKIYVPGLRVLETSARIDTPPSWSFRAVHSQTRTFSSLP